MDDNDVVLYNYNDDDMDDERVAEWEAGLPNLTDLTPLSQSLIPHDLASAFSISPEPYRTSHDVSRASDNTISALRASNSVSMFQSDKAMSKGLAATDTATMMVMDEDIGGGGGDVRKMERMENTEEADGSADDQSSARALKRPRLVWTPQLHKRFVEVVSHLGLNNAVPKTIMQMMNVDGLTRENVASHLQKYRLYLKRQSGEGPAFSDQIFGSEGYSQHARQQQQQTQTVMPMVAPASYHPFDSYHHNMMQQHQQRDWSSANNYASLASHAND